MTLVDRYLLMSFRPCRTRAWRSDLWLWPIRVEENAGVFDVPWPENKLTPHAAAMQGLPSRYVFTEALWPLQPGDMQADEVWEGLMGTTMDPKEIRALAIRHLTEKSTYLDQGLRFSCARFDPAGSDLEVDALLDLGYTPDEVPQGDRTLATSMDIDVALRDVPEFVSSRVLTRAIIGYAADAGPLRQDPAQHLLTSVRYLLYGADLGTLVPEGVLVDRPWSDVVQSVRGAPLATIGDLEHAKNFDFTPPPRRIFSEGVTWPEGWTGPR